MLPGVETCQDTSRESEKGFKNRTRTLTGLRVWLDGFREGGHHHRPTCQDTLVARQFSMADEGTDDPSSYEFVSQP